MKKQTHQTENSSLSTLSRRQFLQGTAATCLAASMLTACSGSDGGDDYFDSVGHDNVEPKEGTWHYSHCRACIRGECSNEYMMVNDVVTEFRGNKKSPYNKGTMCPRGQSAIQHLYNPYRVKAPMKRTNPQKGLDQDPGWMEITWEEALSTVSAKLAEARAKDPRRIVYQVGFGDMDFFEAFLIYFPLASGSSWLESNGPLCAVHFASAYVQGEWPTTGFDLSQCKYHITMGRSLGMGFATANGVSRAVVNAMTEGKTKIVDINPRLSPEGTKGEWVPIKPGTDLAFLLAMAYTIIFEIGEYDEDFLKWRTNAPYLIKPDGHYYTGADGKPQILNADGNMKSFDAYDSDDPADDPDIDGIITVDGQELKASFVLIKEHLNGTNRSDGTSNAYDAEWAEGITTIPAATIRRLSAEFVEAASIGSEIDLGDGVTLPLRPASIILEKGSINQRDGTQADLMSKVVNMLIGCLEMPGGAIASVRDPSCLSVNPETGVVAPKGEAAGHDPSFPPQSLELEEYFICQHSMPHLAYKIIKDPAAYGIDFEVDAMIVIGSNPVGSDTESDMVADSFASIPFVTTIAYHYDESAVLSDILMPSHSMYERENVNVPLCDFTGFTEETIGLNVAMYREPVPALYDTKLPAEIMMEISDRMGILRGPGGVNFLMNMVGAKLGGVTQVPLAGTAYEIDINERYTLGELWDRALKVMFGDNIDRDYLKQHEGVYYTRAPKSEWYNSAPYKKGETRHPFYFDMMQTKGEQLRKVLDDNNVSIPGWGPAEQEEHLKYYEAMPTWRANPINDPNAGGEYNLIAFNFKLSSSPFKTGAVDQMPWLNEVSETFDPYYNTICVHPSAAGGLRDGSIVTVESANGKIQGKLRLTQMIHPETVGIGGATGRRVKTLGSKAASLTHYNLLTNGKLGNIDPISGGITNSVRVKVY